MPKPIIASNQPVTYHRGSPTCPYPDSHQLFHINNGHLIRFHFAQGIGPSQRTFIFFTILYNLSLKALILFSLFKNLSE